MHYSSLLLPLLTLSVSSAVHVARNPKRHHTPGGADLSARAPAAEAQAQVPAQELVRRSTKGKRLVKKKRGTCAAKPPTGGNSTTSAIGGGNWATPSASATFSASASASASASSDDSASASASASSSAWDSSAAASSTSSSAAAASSSASPPPSNSPWKLSESWQGNSFFDHWDFWAWDDPTHGTVDYQGASDAWNQGLIRITGDGHAIMDVDKTQQVSGRGRKSIRLHGKRRFTGGMVLMDAYHMPTGCGTWPAWWMNGDNWPYGGEIDILEGVNAFGQNQVSLHTGSGCHMPNNLDQNQLGTLTTGNYDSYNCASYETANQGCGVRDMSNAHSYGANFNAIQGGVYALVWTQEAIQVYFFERSKIPADITNEQPDPTGWGKPVANFPGSNCNPYQFFTNNFNIFDTTFCGDWAGADGVWQWAGYAGQAQSCAAMTGYATCSDYVLNQGSQFTEAYWEVGYVKYFDTN